MELRFRFGRVHGCDDVVVQDLGDRQTRALELLGICRIYRPTDDLGLALHREPRAALAWITDPDEHAQLVHRFRAHLYARFYAPARPRSAVPGADRRENGGRFLPGREVLDACRDSATPDEALHVFRFSDGILTRTALHDEGVRCVHGVVLFADGPWDGDGAGAFRGVRTRSPRDLPGYEPAGRSRSARVRGSYRRWQGERRREAEAERLRQAAEREEAARAAELRMRAAQDRRRREDRYALARQDLLAEFRGTGASTVRSTAVPLDADDVTLALRWTRKHRGALERIWREVRRDPAGLRSRAGELHESEPARPLAFELARVLSARMAEKAVRHFLLQEPHGSGWPGGAAPVVHDASARQLTAADGAAPVFDLEYVSAVPDPATRAPVRRYIDVKNATAPAGAARPYREHTVQKDRDRVQGTPITFFATVTPRVAAERLLDPCGDVPITMLGEISAAHLTTLETSYSLGALKVRLEGTASPAERTPRLFLPPWMFDAPRQGRHTFEQIRSEWAAAADALQPGDHYEQLPLPARIRCGIPIERDEVREEWQLEFARSLQAPGSHAMRSLPDLYLSILAHFFGMVTGHRALPHGYHPSGYRPLIFSTDGGNRPLGITDPLGTVSNLIGTLDRLAGYGMQPLSRFEHFEFHAAGVLYGYMESTKDREKRCTLMMTHCAGSDCRRVDLMVGTEHGQERICAECRWLICSGCGACRHTQGARCSQSGTLIADRREVLQL